MPVSQRVAQVCLFLVAAIAIFGGTVQMFAAAHTATDRTRLQVPAAA